jgi:hypothetical protein
MANAIFTFTTGIPVVWEVDIQRVPAHAGGAMNHSKRLLFGALSSLLLAVGFVRAADRFDPVTNDLTSKAGQQLYGSPDCTQLCDEVSASPDCTQLCDEVSD